MRRAASSMPPARKVAVAFRRQQQRDLHLVQSRAILPSLPDAGRNMSSARGGTRGIGAQGSFLKRLLGDADNGEAIPPKPRKKTASEIPCTGTRASQPPSNHDFRANSVHESVTSSPAVPLVVTVASYVPIFAAARALNSQPLDPHRPPHSLGFFGVHFFPCHPASHRMAEASMNRILTASVSMAGIITFSNVLVLV